MKPYILVFLFLWATVVNSATDVMRRNIKLPSQAVLQVEELSAPEAAGDIDVVEAVAMGAAVQVITVMDAQPDVARNLVLTPGGTTADIAAGNVIVYGKDIYGQSISETFALTANQSAATTGNKAFLIVDRVEIPVGDSPFGGTLELSVGAKLGFAKCMSGTGQFLKGLVDGVNLTGSTIAASATALESNTFIPDPAANGTRNFTVYYFQNYQCAE